MKNKKFLMVFIGISFLFTFSLSTYAEVIELKFAHHIPPKAPPATAFLKWAKAVESAGKRILPDLTAFYRR